MLANMEKIGQGQDFCKACESEGKRVQLTHVKVLTLEIKHKNGTELASIRYLVPLCDAHRGDGSLDIKMAWQPDLVPIEEIFK